MPRRDGVVMPDAQVGEFPRAIGTGFQPSVFDDIDGLGLLSSSAVVSVLSSGGSLELLGFGFRLVLCTLCASNASSLTLSSDPKPLLPFLQFNLQGCQLTAERIDEGILLPHLFALSHHQVFQALQALQEDRVQVLRTQDSSYRRHGSKRLHGDKVKRPLVVPLAPRGNVAGGEAMARW